MAKTYYAEGKEIAYMVRGISIIGGLSVYFYTDLKKVWWLFFVILIGAVAVGEVLGGMWTRKRRKNKGARKTSSSVVKGKSQGKEQMQSSGPIKKLSDAELMKADVNSLSGGDFERIMALYYKDQGYQVERVGGSGDHEVDLILKGKEGYKIAVQCKRWKRNVGNDIVLRLKAGKQVHGCYDAWIVTTSHFTKDAKEAAERLNITLINGLMLEDKLNRWKKKKGVV